MRIASLLPSATEILFAIGRGASVVGVTHECDHPEAVASLPRLTHDLLATGGSAAAIDRSVRSAVADAHTIYRLDTELLREPAPDVVVTQSLCSVCAVDAAGVAAATCTMPSPAVVVDSNPTTLDGVLDSICDIADAVDAGAAGRTLAASLRSRLDAVAERTADQPRPRVALLEWPDPIFAPGHWVPDMVAAAGGHNALGSAGVPSHRVPMEALIEARADVIVLAFCGFDLHETQLRLAELASQPGWIEASRSARLVAIDGSAYVSRPGPRLVDGVETLAWALHRAEGLRPPVRRAAELIEAGWVDVASFAPSSAVL